HNAPRQVVLAGTVLAIEAVASRLAAGGTATARLNAATGFHSPLVASASGPLLEFLRQADVRAPVLDVYAGRDAGLYPADPDEVRKGLAAQITAPVGCAEVIEAMYAHGVRTFVEIGAGAALTGLVRQILGEREHDAVSLDRRGQHGVTSLQDGLGRLAVGGLAMDFASLWDGCAPAGGSAAENRPAAMATATVTIDGGNYGRPYPPTPDLTGGAPSYAAASPRDSPPQPPPAAPAIPAAAAPAAPAAAAPAFPAFPAAASLTLPAAADEGWLRIIEDAQRQTAAAQADFQRTMTESHLTYLRMAETTLAGLLGGGGEGPARPPSPGPGGPGGGPRRGGGAKGPAARRARRRLAVGGVRARPPPASPAVPPAISPPGGQA